MPIDREALVVAEGIETLEGVANERQTEVGIIRLARSLGLSAHLGRGVDLRDLIDGEVLSVDAAGELGLERRADLAKTVPVDAAKERVLLQLGGTSHVAESVLRVADEAVKPLGDKWHEI